MSAWAPWFSAGAGSISAMAAGWSWWQANLSRKAKLNAESARDATRAQLAAMEQLAEAAQRAYPKPRDVAFKVEYMQQAQFRLRNVGTKTATNIKFVHDEDDPAESYIPKAEWMRDEPVTLKPSGWADFEARGFEPLSQRTVYPKVVSIRFDESAEPINLETPLSNK